MGLFDFLKKKDTTNTTNTTTSTGYTSPVDTTTEAKTSPVVTAINMSKHIESFDKVVVNMSKTSAIDMGKHTARVAFCMDYSGSMDWLYDNGTVQRIVNRLLPIALKFDDNGELEAWMFSNEYDSLKPVTINNYENYVRKVMRNTHINMGGTYYAPALRDIVSYYKDKHPSTIPSYVIFITDGENMDRDATNKIIRELSNYNIFIQFVGIGDENFSYLKQLDNLSGRTHDNTGFIGIYDIDKCDDNRLYTELMSQYVDWLKTK